MIDNAINQTKTIIGKNGQKQMQNSSSSQSTGFTIIKPSQARIIADSSSKYQEQKQKTQVLVESKSLAHLYPQAKQEAYGTLTGGPMIMPSQSSSNCIQQQQQPLRLNPMAAPKGADPPDSSKINLQQIASYKQSTEVLYARPINNKKFQDSPSLTTSKDGPTAQHAHQPMLTSQSSSSAAKKQAPVHHREENFPRVMQREKRQNKYQVKQHRDSNNNYNNYGIKINSHQQDYQPLRRCQQQKQQQYAQRDHLDYSHGQKQAGYDLSLQHHQHGMQRRNFNKNQGTTHPHQQYGAGVRNEIKERQQLNQAQEAYSRDDEPASKCDSSKLGRIQNNQFYPTSHGGSNHRRGGRTGAANNHSSGKVYYVAKNQSKNSGDASQTKRRVQQLQQSRQTTDQNFINKVENKNHLNQKITEVAAAEQKGKIRLQQSENKVGKEQASTVSKKQQFAIIMDNNQQLHQQESSDTGRFQQSQQQFHWQQKCEMPAQQPQQQDALQQLQSQPQQQQVQLRNMPQHQYPPYQAQQTHQMTQHSIGGSSSSNCYPQHQQTLQINSSAGLTCFNGQQHQIQQQQQYNSNYMVGFSNQNHNVYQPQKWPSAAPYYHHNQQYSCDSQHVPTTPFQDKNFNHASANGPPYFQQQMNQLSYAVPAQIQSQQQILSTPLRVKAYPQSMSIVHPDAAKKKVISKPEPIAENQEAPTDTSKKQITTNIGSVRQDTQTYNLEHNDNMAGASHCKSSSDIKNQQNTVESQHDLTMMGAKIYASTVSADVSEVQGSANVSALVDGKDGDATNQHEQTFHCLANHDCTKWYLLAQVGNSQIKIPAKNLAVKFSENAQELPILTQDTDLIERIVRREESLASSSKPITQLNRPVNAGNNPSSSNNMSNNGYRKKDNVQQAQREYDNKMKLNLVGDQTHEKIQKMPLYLPIPNNSQDAYTRIVDLYLHQRTQQLMCIEFDLTHLKLDEQDSSNFSEDDDADHNQDYSGELSINPKKSGNGKQDTSQQRSQQEPTPFMGVPKKKQGYSSYGQPSNVLYINKSQDNNVARQLRVINQEYVEQITYFKLNGECHGKLVFEHDLKYQVQGKKVIKSIQERLIRAKDHIYNEIVRMEPGITQRNVSKSSSSKSREATDRKGGGQQKTHQRTQKSILSSLRGRNKRNKGPYLRRPDEIHIPIVNVTKSLGLKMFMSNLASIDNMLTNFNQIVMQEGLIQSFFLSFDLPVHQLSTASPAISNNLVVKIPRDIIFAQGRGVQNSYHQQAYLAYQQHQAAMTLSNQILPSGHQQQQQNKNGGGQLWDLVGEFKKISSAPGQQVVVPPGGGAGQTQVPVLAPPTYQVQQQNFSNHVMIEQPFLKPACAPAGYNSGSASSMTTSAACGGAATAQHHQQLTNVTSLHSFLSIQASGNSSNMSQQPLPSASAQTPFFRGNPLLYGVAGGCSQQSQDASSSNQSQHQQLQHSNATNMNSALMRQVNGGVPPQQLHQALYSLRDDQHQPVQLQSLHHLHHGNNHQGSVMESANGFESLLEQPAAVYVPPEDPNYMSNLDRLLEAMTPRVASNQLPQTSMKEFFKAFRQVSVYGLRVELLNEQTLQSELFTFTPTLSSLVLSYTKPAEATSKDDHNSNQINRIVDIDDTTSKEENKILDSVTATYDQHGVKPEESSTCQVMNTTQKTMPPAQLKFIEHHETEPHYLRPAFFAKIKEIISEVPHLKQVMLNPKSFKFESSWFSMLWTCQRVCTIPSAAQEETNSEQEALCMGQDDESAKNGSSAVTNIQFLAIFRFRPDPYSSHLKEQSAYDQKDQKRHSNRSEPVQLIGLLPYKLDRESFWVSPSHLQTDNNLQGEMYDQICEDNIILLQDLKQRAIEFLQPQASREDMHDFTHLLNSTNSSIFDFF